MVKKGIFSIQKFNAYSIQNFNRQLGCVIFTISALSLNTPPAKYLVYYTDLFFEAKEFWVHDVVGNVVSHRYPGAESSDSSKAIRNSSKYFWQILIQRKSIDDLPLVFGDRLSDVNFLDKALYFSFAWCGTIGSGRDLSCTRRKAVLIRCYRK